MFFESVAMLSTREARVILASRIFLWESQFMSRLLTAALIFGGCLLTIGCDTSAGTGNVGPQMSLTGSNFDTKNTENVKIMQGNAKLPGKGDQPPPSK